MEREFDLIVFGATGFIGRLVAVYLHHARGSAASLRWALAARDPQRLRRVRDELGFSPRLPLLTADALDDQAMRGLAGRTRAVLTTVGPYQRLGTALVTACAEAGTDYVDLCGEPAWMARMIDGLSPIAQASGARIVFSCGFDSMPFDLGVLLLQLEARHRFGRPLRRVHAGVKTLKGGWSGGTVETLMASLQAARDDPAVARVLKNPFALTPGFAGPDQADDGSVTCDTLTQSWTAPFVMAPINRANVHRTHALLGHPWGRDFVYTERLLTGNGPSGERRARRIELGQRLLRLALDAAPLRALLRRFVLPRPGKGPSPADREAGHYEIRFHGETADGKRLRAALRGERDPGYGSSSRLVSEAALCLLDDVDRSLTPGGVWTPGAAMGLTLLRRLQAHAGIHVAVG